MFKGSITALVTPFRDGKVDERAFQDLVEWQIAEGSHGLVPVGTTGESPTLSHHEHKRVVELCVEVTAGRVPVIAGAGSNNTEEALDFARHAEKVGATGILVVTPYYNKPNQEGLYRHFRAVAEGTRLPIVIYNIPPRSVIDMAPETMARVRQDCPNVIGVKDATMKLDRVSRTRQVVGPDFVQLSGEDGTALAFNAQGGSGCISVTANVAPALCAAFQEACGRGDYAEALALQDRLWPLHEALFVDPNPTGAKYALSVLGRTTDEVRLPLAPAGEAARRAIDAALAHAGLA